jgi:hypothetical protein
VRASFVATVSSLCLALAFGAPSPQRPAEQAVPNASRPAAALDVAGCPLPSVASTAVGTNTVASSTRHPSRIVVAVFVHVLRDADRGGVERSRIRSQLQVLNSAFAGRESRHSAESPFRFRLADVDVTSNRAWYRMDEGTLAEEHAKRALHRGTAADLNLYIGANATGVLGWGTQPTAYSEQPRLDGVVVARHTLPGGRHGRYSAGDDAVHETGHWLGLFHTFQGGCSGRGDRVADTPSEATPSYSCHERRNTCSAPGNDPVHNFMDYGDDGCMNAFTPGQVDRMVVAWSRLRAAGAPT